MSNNDFTPISKMYSGGAVKEPMVSVREDSMGILTSAYKEMGEPDALRFFIDGNRIAMVPDDRDHADSYAVTSNEGDAGGSVSCNWFKYELDHGEQPEGRFPVEQDGDLWIVDFSDPEGEQA